MEDLQIAHMIGGFALPAQSSLVGQRQLPPRTKPDSGSPSSPLHSTMARSVVAPKRSIRGAPKTKTGCATCRSVIAHRIQYHFAPNDGASRRDVSSAVTMLTQAIEFERSNATSISRRAKNVSTQVGPATATKSRLDWFTVSPMHLPAATSLTSTYHTGGTPLPRLCKKTSNSSITTSQPKLCST